ncbi:hypothetical protein DV515_00015259 [Chloebia gouldiae]|uniref:Uncharacterized protein n=1 Tax=Chloebia gouldiae TaxID=44316 RepID=A0A3L8RVQ1_CHLGU|nr:hypothetical protein DV515_00015259 [Chloebia gouldiae]
MGWDIGRHALFPLPSVPWVPRKPLPTQPTCPQCSGEYWDSSTSSFSSHSASGTGPSAIPAFSSGLGPNAQSAGAETELSAAPALPQHSLRWGDPPGPLPTPKPEPAGGSTHRRSRAPGP